MQCSLHNNGGDFERHVPFDTQPRACPILRMQLVWRHGETISSLRGRYESHRGASANPAFAVVLACPRENPPRESASRVRAH